MVPQILIKVRIERRRIQPEKALPFVAFIPEMLSHSGILFWVLSSMDAVQVSLFGLHRKCI